VPQVLRSHLALQRFFWNCPTDSTSLLRSGATLTEIGQLLRQSHLVFIHQ
jgi:hypothetical protein